VTVNDQLLSAGDGFAVDGPTVALTGDEGSEALVFDLP